MSNLINTTDQALTELADLIKKLQFDEAEKILNTNFRSAQFIRVLHTITEQKLGLLTYTFVIHLVLKYKNAFWHRVAAYISSESLDHVTMSNDSGLYHILEAIKLDPTDWTLKEFALDFFKDGILDKKTAQQFAQEVIKYEPKNQLAIKILAL